MNEPAKKRRSAWKILGIVLGAIVLSIVALALWASAVGNRNFARMQEVAKARMEEMKNRDPRRPTLRGEAEEGNAWDDYFLAQAELKKFADAGRLNELVSRTPKADPQIGKTALASHGAAVDQLRRGAGRASARYPYEWERGANMPIPRLLDSINLANLAVLKSRALMEEGKSREAAGVLLDVCQYGRDLASDGLLISYMIGVSMLRMGFHEMRDHLAAGAFDRPTLEDLARGLETLEAQLPRYGDALLNDGLMLGGMLDESIAGTRGPQRLLYADVVERTVEWMTRAGKAEALSWPEAQKEFQRIETEAQKSWNPLSRITVPSLARSSRISRERRAELRMLRIAVQALSTGETIDLNDPFGAKLLKSEKDGRLRIWSIGADGVDDGGMGDWKSDSKDLVLDLKK